MTYNEKNHKIQNFNTHSNKFHSSEKDIMKKENDINYLLEELHNSPKASFNKMSQSNFKKENLSPLPHLQSDFFSTSPKIGKKNNYYDIMNKGQIERNKKIEIILNARLREQKTLERKTQMYFFDEYYSTNSSNLRSLAKNDSKYEKNEKLDKYKYDFIKIHKKQIENEKDKKNLLKKLLEKTNNMNQDIRKSLDIGKFHYFLKSQFEDKSFFDDCLEDSFFLKDPIDKKLVNKSPNKSNFDIFRDKVKVLKNKTIYESNINFIQDAYPKSMLKHIPSELVEKDENFKKIFEKLMLGNKKFIESREKLNEELEKNRTNKHLKKSSKNNNTTFNSNTNIEKFNNLENKSMKFFVFTCTDCEIDTAALFGLSPDEVFVYKNIGNIIISKDVNLLCAIQYAIETLNIRNFIILGHTSCFALREAIFPTKNGIINKWLKNIRLIAEENRHLLYEAKRDVENYDLNFSQLNIKEQMKRFSQLSLIQNINRKGEKVYIHGFHLLNSSGKVNEIEVLHSSI